MTEAQRNRILGMAHDWQRQAQRELRRGDLDSADQRSHWLFGVERTLIAADQRTAAATVRRIRVELRHAWLDLQTRLDDHRPRCPHA